MRVIEQVVPPTRQRKMKDDMRVIQHFLKYQYDGHILEDDQVSGSKRECNQFPVYS